jgi:hypothetical protein
MYNLNASNVNKEQRVNILAFKDFPQPIDIHYGSLLLAQFNVHSDIKHKTLRPTYKHPIEKNMLELKPTLHRRQLLPLQNIFVERWL